MVTVEQGILILNQRRYRGRHNTTGNRFLRTLPCSCIGHLHIPVPQDLRGPQPYYSNLPGGDTFKGDIVVVLGIFTDLMTIPAGPRMCLISNSFPSS